MVFPIVRAVGGRSKKLIAALLLTSEETFARVYDCRTCDFEERAARGCISEVEGMVWEIKDVCLSCSPFCASVDPIRDAALHEYRYLFESDGAECPACKGSGHTEVRRCPRALAGSRELWLLPYFYEYYAGVRNGVFYWPYPGGRMAQPVKIVKAFDLLMGVMGEPEAPEKKKHG